MEGLNFQQKEAVLHIDGPLLILAGAGAGKTKTVTHRIMHIIKSGVAPQNILAITFTNKAAKEMRDRVGHLLNQNQENQAGFLGERPFVSTFHALGVYILRENSKLIGLNKTFNIADKSDATKLIKEALEELSIDPKQFDPSKISRVISKEKGNMRSVDDYRQVVGKEFFSNIVVRVWEKYEAALRREQCLDFDDLLLKTARILSDHKDILEKYQNQWQYIHIDEYQDTNMVQYKIAKMLASRDRKICVVGDVDQTIYSWRGADIRNIMDFEKDYPEARIILLEENYRSTQTILNTANNVIRKNKNRPEKNLFTKNGQGDKIGFFEGYDEIEEAHFIAEKSAELIRSGIDPEEIAVLYRANFQSRVLEDAFLTHNVPYQMLGTKFFERKEIKDALSYLRLSLNPDSLADLKRIINSPARGIGKVTLLKILEGREADLRGVVQEKIYYFRRLISSIKELAETGPTSAVMKFIIKQSGLENEYKNNTEEGMEKLENLQELVTLATKYDGFEGLAGSLKLLEDAALASDQDELKEEKKGVKLMTIHASKGLEFKTVFITGLEEDLFPHKRMSEEEVSDNQAEEERRLFYVALTRAKERLFLTTASMRTIFGSKKMNVPSEFLADIDEKDLEIMNYSNYLRKERIIYI